MATATRRKFLWSLTGGAAIVPFLSAQTPETLSAPLGAPDRLLDEIERRACAYFFEQADPETGLVLDRAGRRSRV